MLLCIAFFEVILQVEAGVRSAVDKVFRLFIVEGVVGV